MFAVSLSLVLHCPVRLVESMASYTLPMCWGVGTVQHGWFPTLMRLITEF